jgi:hypothetical protein
VTARLRRIRIVIGVAAGDAAEIFERLEIVLRDTLASGVHPAELPLCQRVTHFGSVFERVHRLDGVAGLEPIRSGAERLHRRHRRRTQAPVGLAAVERARGRGGHQAGADQQHAQEALNCPHSTLSQPRRQDELPRR